MSVSKTEHDELEVQYETLNKRIAALNSDLAVTLDSEQKYTLQQRLAAANKERDVLADKLGKPRINGDLDKLRHKVDELASAIEDGNPSKTHAVISECYNILRDFDDRVSGVEMRVDIIEHRLDPPLSVIFWRVIASITLIAGILVFAIPYLNYVFFSTPLIGLFIEALIVSFALVLLWVGRITAISTRQQISLRRGRNAR
jgi:hypothetical protein